jgi:hypothetical protein
MRRRMRFGHLPRVLAAHRNVTAMSAAFLLLLVSLSVLAAGRLLSPLLLCILTTALIAVPSCVFRQTAAINAAQDTRRYKP